MIDRLVHTLLRLYPRRWRDRYEAEMRALLVDQGVKAGDLVDLARHCAGEWVQTEFERDGTTVRVVKMAARYFTYAFAFVACCAAGSVVTDVGSQVINAELRAVTPSAEIAGGLTGLAAVAFLLPVYLATSYLMSLRRIMRFWELMKVGAVGRLLTTVSMIAVPVPRLVRMSPAVWSVLLSATVVGISCWRAGIAMIVGATGPLTADPPPDVIAFVTCVEFGWLGLSALRLGWSKPGERDADEVALIRA